MPHPLSLLPHLSLPLPFHRTPFPFSFPLPHPTFHSDSFRFQFFSFCLPFSSFVFISSPPPPFRPSLFSIPLFFRLLSISFPILYLPLYLSRRFPFSFSGRSGTDELPAWRRLGIATRVYATEHCNQLAYSGVYSMFCCCALRMLALQ